MSRELLESQIAFRPVMSGAFSGYKFVVGGMGGSALPALAAKYLGVRGMEVWRSYGLPSELAPDATCIAISYSGNTEETLSFFEEALARNLPVAVITSGGKLLARAQESGVSYVLVPQGVQPRDALLAMTKALLTLIRENEKVAALDATADVADAVSQDAEAVTDFLTGSIPIVYASSESETLAYIMKITFNETAKVPAFANVFPELNHNEMQGLAGRADAFAALLIADSTDDLRIARRMGVFTEVMQAQGLRVKTLNLPQDDAAHRLVYVWMLARSAARLLAERAGVDPDAVPLIEEFKRKLAS